jgi:CRP-like cAMP-binding protein
LLSTSSSSPVRKGYLELPLRRLACAGPLSADEEAAIRDLAHPRRISARGDRLLAPGDDGLHFVLEGWGCQMRPLDGNRRQIFSFLLPGDVIGCLPGDPAPSLSQSVALTHATTIDASALIVYPGIKAAMTALHISAQSRLFDQLLRLGAHGAYEGVAHLLLEIYTRHAEIGLAEDSRFSFPVGQERLGEMLGLSEVHVNRTLTRLRADGHLAAGPGWFSLPRAEDLAARVGFTPSPAWMA